MLLTITTTRPPATDLGYLLHEHPARAQSVELPWGQAHKPRHNMPYAGLQLKWQENLGEPAAWI